jgi:hypothetical protein
MSKEYETERRQIGLEEESFNLQNRLFEENTYGQKSNRGNSITARGPNTSNY